MKTNNTQKGALINTNALKNMLRYKTETRPGLVALYDIRPGNGAGPFLQPRSPHGALCTWKTSDLQPKCQRPLQLFYPPFLMTSIMNQMRPNGQRGEVVNRKKIGRCDKKRLWSMPYFITVKPCSLNAVSCNHLISWRLNTDPII